MLKKSLICLFLFVLSSFVSADGFPTTNLDHKWSFTTDATDDVGSEDFTTVTADHNAGTSIHADFAGYYDFTASNSDEMHNNAFGGYNGDFTIFGWYKPNDCTPADEQYLVHIEDDQSTSGELLRLVIDTSGHLDAVYSDYGFGKDGTNDCNTEWQSFAVTYDVSETTWELFHNGTSYGTDTANAHGGLEDFVLGARFNNQDFFDGAMDQIYFFGEVVTDANILKIHDDMLTGLDVGESVTVPKNLYVDTDGIGGACSDAIDRDANNITNPWCTIDEIQDNAESGDTAYLRKGEYNEKVEFGSTNQFADPLIVTSYPGEEANWTYYHTDMAVANNGCWDNKSNNDINLWKLDIASCPASIYDTYAVVSYGNGSILYPYDELSFINSTDHGGFDSSYSASGTPDTLYVRFNDTTKDPNDFALYVNGQYGNLVVNEASNIEFHNITFIHNRWAVYLLQSHDITFDGLNIIGGLSGIRVLETGTVSYGINVYNCVIWNNIRDSDNLYWYYVKDYSYLQRMEGSGIHIERCDKDCHIEYNNISGFFNGIFFGNSDSDYRADNSVIKGNIIHNIFDDAIELEKFYTNTSILNNTIYDVFVANSLAYASCSDQCYSQYNKYSVTKRIEIEPGSYWGGKVYKLDMGDTANWTIDHETGYVKVPSQTDVGFQCSDVGGNFADSNFTNNIIYVDSGRAYDRTDTYANGNHFDYNLLYDDTDSTVGRYWNDNADGTEYSLANWKLSANNETTWELNSAQADPQFLSVDPDNQYFLVPVIGSTACSMSSTGSYVGALPCAPDINTPILTTTVYTEYYEFLNVSQYFKCKDVEGIANVSLYINDTLNYTNSVYINNSNGYLYINPTEYTNYSYYVSCTDIGGNTVNSSVGWLHFVRPPNAYLYEPTANSYFEPGSIVNINASCQSVYGLTSVSVRIRDSDGLLFFEEVIGGLSDTYSYNFTNTTNMTISGKYNIKLTCQGDAGSIPTNISINNFYILNDVINELYLEDQVLLDFSDSLKCFTNITLFNSSNSVITYWWTNSTDQTIKTGNTTCEHENICTVDDLTNKYISAYDSFTCHINVSQLGFPYSHYSNQLNKSNIGECVDTLIYPIVNISYFNEQTNGAITTNAYYNIFLYDGSGSTQYNYTFYGNYSDLICTDINPAVNTITLLLYGSITLEKTDFNTRVYNIPFVEGFTISNNPYTKMSLYLLPTTNSSTITYNWYTTTFEPVIGNMLIYRCELDGTRTLVDAPLISDGMATSNLQLFTTSYSYEVVIDGETYTDDSYTACQVESITERSFYVDITRPTLLPLIELSSVTCRLYKSGANTVKLSWDADDIVEACITADRTTISGKVQIYEDCTELSSGTMTRLISNNTETYYVYGSINDGTYTIQCLDTQVFNNPTDAGNVFGIYGAFSVGLLILAIGLLLAPKGQDMIIGSILALVVSFLLGFMAFGWASLFIIITFLIFILYVGRFHDKQ